MEDTELDYYAEINRLMTGPLDALRERIAFVTDGHYQVVFIDYVLNAMLLRYSDGPRTEASCHASFSRFSQSNQPRFRSSRHDDKDRRAIYYAVALPGSPCYKHPWIIYQGYAKPEARPWYAGEGYPRQQNNALLAGYTGDKFIDVVYAPYLPLFVTP
jgi:hypothetical protein